MKNSNHCAFCATSEVANTKFIAHATKYDRKVVFETQNYANRVHKQHFKSFVLNVRDAVNFLFGFSSFFFFLFSVFFIIQLKFFIYYNFFSFLYALFVNAKFCICKQNYVYAFVCGEKKSMKIFI